MIPEKHTVTTRNIPPAMIAASILASTRPVSSLTDPHRRHHTKEAPTGAVLHNPAYKDSVDIPTGNGLSCDPDTARDGWFPPGAGPMRDIGALDLSDKKPPPAPRHNVVC